MDDVRRGSAGCGDQKEKAPGPGFAAGISLGGDDAGVSIDRVFFLLADTQVRGNRGADPNRREPDDGCRQPSDAFTHRDSRRYVDA
jgi:hypothetical protein